MESIEQKQISHITVWAFIGPLLSLMLLFLILFKQVPTPLSLVGIVIGGMVASWIFRLRGLFISLLALSIFLALEWSVSSLEEKYWLFGLSFSAALTFVITALSFEEIDEILFSAEQEEEGRLQQTKNLVEELKKKEEEWEKEASKLKADSAWHKEGMGKKEKEVNALQEQLQLIRIQKEELKQSLAKKEQERNELQRHFTLQLEELTQKLDDKELVPDSYEPLYKQLKEQFADKSALLDETRKEVFAAQEKIVYLEKELQEMDETMIPQEELDRYLSQVGEEVKIYKEEITSLQALLDTFFQGVRTS